MSMKTLLISTFQNKLFLPFADLVCGLFLTAAPTKAQSMAPDPLPPQVLSIGNTLLVYGRQPMIVPQGGWHVRQAEIRIPAVFNGTPTVTATVYSPSSPGTMFSIYNIQMNDFGSQTQVVFSAANIQIGSVSPLKDFLVNYVVTGIKR